METSSQEPAIIDTAEPPCGSLYVTFHVKATTVEDGQIVEDVARAPSKNITVRIEFSRRRIDTLIYPPNVPQGIQDAIRRCAERMIAGLNRIDTVVECVLPTEVVAAYTSADAAEASATIAGS